MPRRGQLLTALFACALVGACDNAPTTTRKPASTASTPATPRAEEVPADMVAAVPAGKTASGITVHFALRATPQVGQALPVDVAIVPRERFPSLRARFEPQAGLTVASGNALGPIPEVAADTPVNHRVELRVERDGLFMLTATVETEDSAGATTRVFYIPVMVNPPEGGAAASASEPVMSPPAG
jgi:hypothetical protein